MRFIKKCRKINKAAFSFYLSRNPCILENDQWSDSQSTPLHIELSNWADILIMPFNSDNISKMGNWKCRGIDPKHLNSKYKANYCCTSNEYTNVAK